MTPTETGTRPRVAGERELEILEATLEVLDEVGYDLLTMDAVASRAKASKATLYRRWKGKPELVVAAIMAHKGEAVVPDTGTLRGDLLAAYCGSGGLNDPIAQTVLTAVVTAMGRDPEFAEVYRRDFIAPEGRHLPRDLRAGPRAGRGPPRRGPLDPRPLARRDRPAPGLPARRRRHARARRPGARRGHPPRRAARPRTLRT